MLNMSIEDFFQALNKLNLSNEDKIKILTNKLIIVSALKDEFIIDFIDQLIEKGADINGSNNIGNTALMNAILSNNLPIVIHLLEKHHADINKSNKKEETAFTLAESADFAIFNFLSFKIKIMINALFNKVEQKLGKLKVSNIINKREVIENLEDDSANVDIKEVLELVKHIRFQIDTALLRATVKKDLPRIKILIEELRATPCSTNRETGKTILDIADKDTAQYIIGILNYGPTSQPKPKPRP